MSLDVGAIRASMAAAASSSVGVKRALAYIPDKVDIRDLPLVAIGNPEPITYNRTFGSGTASLTFRVTVLITGASEAEKATAALDAFVSLSANSLASALRQERSTVLAPWVVNVRSVETYAVFTFESVSYHGIQLVVDVTA